jgi:hypothetical protein
MISSQLGTAQLGLVQLAGYNPLETPGSVPPVTPSTSVIDGSTVSILVLPNHFIMMGRWQITGDKNSGNS